MEISNEHKHKDIIQIFKQGDYDTALHIIQENLSEEQCDNVIINALIGGRILLKKGEFDEAMMYFDICKKELDNNLIEQPTHLVPYHLWTGTYHYLQERYEQALESFLIAEKASEQIISYAWWEEDNLMYLYYNMGALYYTLNFFEDSQTYCDKAVELADRHKNKGILGFVYSIKGSLALAAGEYDKAAEYYQLALVHNIDKIDVFNKFVYLKNMGELNYLKGDYYQALECLEETQTLNFEAYSNQSLWKAVNASTHNIFGKIYVKFKEFDKAEKYLYKALKLVEETNNNEVKKEIYQSLCDIFTQQKNHEKAYLYAQKIVELQKGELRYVTDARIATLRVRYERQNRNKMIADFSQTVEELKATNSYLGQIASSISHDVRAPIRTAIGYMGLLARKYDSIFNEEAKDYIHTAIEAAKDAQMLTKSLSDLGKINLNQNNIKTVRIDEIIRRVRRNLEQEIQEKNVQFKLSKLPVIETYEGQILQLFQNLIANGIKYNESQAPIISITYEKTADNKHLFSVSDNGIGVDPKYHEHIFHILKRLHTKDKYKGSGIGLAICALIVKKHEGDIWVESEVGQGATFKFTLTPIETYSDHTPDQVTTTTKPVK